ncbi:MAG: hypothetical protein Q8840_02580, partial [Sweet potato little leaf phytoplasma]|nr:hypothetical protein [Sweet potato little leaf phytoplasma]
RIQDNDLDTKMKKAKDFLKSGQKVKINMSLDSANSKPKFIQFEETHVSHSNNLKNTPNQSQKYQFKT